MAGNGDVIVVFGGTGQQGGAVARELLRRGRTVRAVVRDPESEKARALAEAGAELARGDMEDAASLDEALRGAYGVYSVQPFAGPDGLEGEVRQGRAVADAAARAATPHFVYSSVGGAERDSKVPHFESKRKVEQHIEELGLPATVLRPTFFMSNFRGMGPVPVHEGAEELVLTLAMEPGVPLQMIAVEDIGVFAADAFEDPDRHLGRRVELAGDELTGAQMAEIFSEIAGRPVRFASQPLAELRAGSEEMALMFDWFNKHGYRADIPALKEAHPELITLEAWLRRNWSGPRG
ncbi:NmrA/HSCARG family protein [Streptomyces sp. NPDC059740]|uniref:NmrA/HSCARG family protein n=1 Tax=Streptomyces sp. NPDC059740 TaxID=3346926 RepID=UPI003663C3EC